MGGAGKRRAWGDLEALLTLAEDALEASRRQLAQAQSLARAQEAAHREAAERGQRLQQALADQDARLKRALAGGLSGPDLMAHTTHGQQLDGERGQASADALVSALALATALEGVEAARLDVEGRLGQREALRSRIDAQATRARRAGARQAQEADDELATRPR